MLRKRPSVKNGGGKSHSGKLLTLVPVFCEWTVQTNQIWDLIWESHNVLKCAKVLRLHCSPSVAPHYLTLSPSQVQQQYWILVSTQATMRQRTTPSFITAPVCQAGNLRKFQKNLITLGKETSKNAKKLSKVYLTLLPANTADALSMGSSSLFCRGHSG